MTAWPPERKAELERLWASGMKPREIRGAMGLTEGQLRGRVTKYNLPPRHRHPPKMPALAHPAVVSGHTLFPGRVGFAGDVLKPGANQKKLGDVVQKGAWKGFPIFALTLEERATCPRTCRQWQGCYGNHMHWSKRMPHGPELERLLWSELRSLQRKYPNGYVVRLHVLGDFYSVDYVDLWRRALDEFPALHVFGYTAHRPDSARSQGTPIGNAIDTLRREHWARFAIRQSGGHHNVPRAIVIDAPSQAANAIICPAQTGKTKNCSTCALCWAAPSKTIAFLRH